MIIKVTKEDIENGIKRNARKCPVALALNKKGFYNSKVLVNSIMYKEKSDLWNNILFWDFSHRYVINERKLPKEVGIFIARFDAGLIVEPFEFKI